MFFRGDGDLEHGVSDVVAGAPGLKCSLSPTPASVHRTFRGEAQVSAY